MTQLSNGRNVVKHLYQAMDESVPHHLYPPGVPLVPAEKIAGTALFPGGSGLYLEEDGAIPEFPFDRVMVCGHNFDSEAGFKASVARGKENLTSGTWGPLLRLLGEAGVPLKQCFFTNAFMGLCEGKDGLQYQGRDDNRFRHACGTFLMTQIAVQRPRLILTLGLHVPPMFAERSPDLAFWSGRKLRLKDLDAVPFISNARFGTTHRAHVVPLAHPSLPNAWRRKPMGFSPGRQGEIEIIKDSEGCR